MVLLSALQTARASSVDDLIRNYTEPDNALLKEDIAIGSGNFVLVTINGDETLLINKGTLSIVRDEGSIKSILTDHLYASLGYDSRLSAISSLVDDYNKSRYPEEDKCRQYTGTDRYECTSKEACIVACLSVPLCSGIYAAANFIDSVMNWSDETSKIDENLAGFTGGIDGIKEGGKAIDDEIEELDGIKEASLRNKENLLLLNLSEGGFEFCPKINYGINSLDEAIDGLEGLKDDLDALDEIPGRAKDIKERTEQQITYIETRGEKYASLSEKVLKTKNELSGKANGLLLLVNSADVEGKLSALRNISDEITGLGDKGCYGTAFSKEGDFLSKASSLNSSVSTISKRYDVLLEAKKRCLQKIANATTIVGANDTELNESLAALNAKYSNITKKLLSPIQPDEIITTTEELNNISSSVNELILGKMLSQKEGESQKGDGGKKEEAGAGNVANLVEEKGKECIGTLWLISSVLLFAFLRW